MSINEFSDPELVRLVNEKNSSDAIVELERRHSGLITKISQRYSSKAGASGVRLEDLLDDAPLVIFESAKKYDPTLGFNFNTFLGSNMKFHCLNKINSEHKYFKIFEPFASIDENDSGVYSEEDKVYFNNYLENRDVLDEKEFSSRELNIQIESVKNLISQLTDDRAKEIFRIRFFSGSDKIVPFSKIATHMNLSTQGVINIFNEGMEIIKKKLNSEIVSDII